MKSRVSRLHSQAIPMHILPNSMRPERGNGLRHQQLLQEGYQPGQPRVNQVANTTEIEIEYNDAQKLTASINALIENETVEEVNLKKNDEDYMLWSMLLLLAILLIILAIVYYTYLKKKEHIQQSIPKPRAFDYRKAALSLLKESRELFQKKQEKDAYGKAGEAIRLYLSHKLDLQKELTNTELIDHLKKEKRPYKDTQKCLNMTMLVEFARYQANMKDFNQIITLAEKIIT